MQKICLRIHEKLCLQVFCIKTEICKWREQQRPQWRWDAGGQITMGAAGREGVFELNPRFEPRKSRQPGAREEESHDEKRLSRSVLQVLCRHFENRALVSSSSVPARPYTDPRQESPDRKCGRQATLSRSSLWTRFSLDGILASNPAEIVEICLEVGILKDGRLDPCEWCEKTNWRIESKRCKTKDCRSSKSVVPIKPAWFLVWIIAQFEIFSSAFASG
eukprot:s7098_g1.t1